MYGYVSLNSANFSDASARIGAMYIALFPLESIELTHPISATSVLPLAVGLAITRFFPSRSPLFIASSCGGVNNFMPLALTDSIISFGSLPLSEEMSMVIFWFKV